MNRRNFFKVLAGGVVGVLAAPVVGKSKPFRPKPIQQHWMQTWGYCDPPYYGNLWDAGVCGINAGEVVYGLKASEQLLGSNLVLPNGRRYICVKFGNNYKKGQALIWNYDGTVRRV